MAPSILVRQSYSSGDDSSNSASSTFSSTRITIIIAIAVIVALKIGLLIWLCHWRNKKRRERQARGCHCCDDMDYCCLPWWYWSSDSRCRCGQLQNNAWPAAGPRAYEPAPPYSSQPHPDAGYYAAQREDQGNAGDAYGSAPMELKPTYMIGQQYEGLHGMPGEGGKEDRVPEVRVQYV
ncbi:hypothetical protein LTR36_001091 [Oleoguttula mirabilis]|uniref:Uncharacterized protein n=1 Tax=Oleoguttula mirabilis TaxID=1507867 RepID=A0AAV9JQ26_9PEZI|nr:hypothetical protein LTR36_001091 [Oleoguttula mirabilis]